MKRLCTISEIGASYLVCKRYVQELHYQQELLHYRELQHQHDQYGKTKSLRNLSKPEALMKKGGGYLLSRIALQYHRRKWA